MEILTCYLFFLSSSSQDKEEECRVVTEEDFEHLCHLVERKDGGPAWKHMMDRSSPNMSCQAWQRDPEVLVYLFIGPFLKIIWI